MSAENVELVRRSFEALALRDEVLWDTIDPEIDVIDHDIPDAGDYHGHAGFGNWLQDWAEAWESWTMEAREFIDAGDSLVVVVFGMTARGRGSGADTMRENATVNAVEDGRIRRVDYYSTKEEALEAAGLAA